MSWPREFSSWLAGSFESFVALKRACGASYISQRNLLIAFDRYVDSHAPKPPLQRETLLQYLFSLQRLSPRSRGNVVGVVWPAVVYAKQHGACVEELPPPPSVPSSMHWRQRLPRIVSITEIQSLLTAARRLSPGSLRSDRTATLVGLLYTTGIRIGEALALDVGDLDRRDRILTIRKGKFGKSRALPLRESTMDSLIRHVEHPLRPIGTEPSAPLFVSIRRRRLAHQTLPPDLSSACLAARLRKPWPCPHDFRHTFAVSRVAEWYAEGRDANALLPVLSTYLGHVSVENTRKYLIANGALLEQAAERFERQTSALDEVLS